MKTALNNFQTNVNDTVSLLDLSLVLDRVDQKRVIFRSAVVLLIAAWEQYVEQLAESSIAVLTDRLRDAAPLPEKVKQNIAKSTVPSDRSNLKVFSDSVWLFAEKGWKDAYIDYCEKLTSRLHSATSSNIKELFEEILGIRDVSARWAFQKLSARECAEKLDDLVDLRHDIAHGANKRAGELSEKNLRSQIKFIESISGTLYQSIFDLTAELSQSQALTYNLTPVCYSQIISLAVKKEGEILTLKEIKNLGSSAQGNHNKLRYAPWALLEFVDRNTRRITDRLFKFYKGEIPLPLEILVFANKEAISKPGTRMVLFSDLQKNHL